MYAIDAMFLSMMCRLVLLVVEAAMVLAAVTAVLKDSLLILFVDFIHGLDSGFAVGLVDFDAAEVGDGVVADGFAGPLVDQWFTADF